MKTNKVKSISYNTHEETINGKNYNKNIKRYISGVFITTPSMIQKSLLHFVIDVIVLF